MIEINNLTKKRINTVRINKIVKFFLKKYPLKLDEPISLALIGDSRMKDINFTYRGKKEATDILSFPELNEIIININELDRQTKKERTSFSKVFEFILVHGLLHLVGFCDHNEKKRQEMINLGNDFLLNLK